MKNLEKIINWFCTRITFNELCSVVVILFDYINNPDKVKLKEDKTEYPNYRTFTVDEKEPLIINEEAESKPDYRELLKEYKIRTGRKMSSVSRHNGKPAPPSYCRCNHCNAPARFLSFNNGKKKTQVRCKVCKKTSAINKRQSKNEAKYRCPYCNYKLFTWKKKKDVTIYKCPNKKCKCYIRNKAKLTAKEQEIYNSGKTNHFSLHYIYRVFDFKPAELVPARPKDTKINLHKAHHSTHNICLALTYSINYGMSSRMTADIMKNVHNVDMCYQTVLNYINAAAKYASDFISKYKPEIKPGEEFAGDETYIKVKGKSHYTWFVINTENKAISGFHLSDQRDTKNALIAYIDAFGGKAEPLKEGELPKLFIADGNPSYDAALHEYLRDIKSKPIIRKKVIGLENLDAESEQYRQPKQLIERLNRTYKFHTRPRSGFKNLQGAIDLTTLFVVFYNYMRPVTRNVKTPPVENNYFDELKTAQQKWAKVLSLVS